MMSEGSDIGRPGNRVITVTGLALIVLILSMNTGTSLSGYRYRVLCKCQCQDNVMILMCSADSWQPPTRFYYARKSIEISIDGMRSSES